MKDYSIETFAEKIYFAKTKEYFKEVSSSYFNGNYRAAVVTLYSVVINDLLLKLEELNGIFRDNKAKGILKEIKEQQSSNPTSSEWEKDIIKRIKQSTQLLDNVDSNRIESLTKDRHLCAHPVVDKEEKLFTPNKETVAAHIRNMLESVLTKPSLLSKKVLSTLVVDIASRRNYLINENETEKYLKAKYFKNLTPNMEVAIFKDLWNFVFHLNNKIAKENRAINFYVLCILYKRNKQDCDRKIAEELPYFSNKIKDDEDTLRFFIGFLAIFDNLYTKFGDDVKILVKNRINEDINAKIVAHFTSSSFTQHLKDIENDIRNTEWNKIGILAENNLIKQGIIRGFDSDIVDYITNRYTKSRCYDEADHLFERMIKPNLKLFTDIGKIEVLCEKSNTNDQVWERRLGRENHKILKEYIEKIKSDFDFSLYPNLFK